MNSWTLQIVYSPQGLVVRSIYYSSKGTAQMGKKKAMTWLTDEFFHAVILPPDKRLALPTTGDSNG